MSRVETNSTTLTAAECARQTGLTVKALRVYERQGLVKPKRTLKDWRIYDATDLARLGEVTALQALGLKLADIAKLLRGSPSGINRMLELQQDELLQRRARIDAGLASISALRRRAAMGETLTINDLASAIKETQMTALSPDTIAWKRYEQMRPRVAIKADSKTLANYVGSYSFEGGMLIHVTTAADTLLAQVQGQPVLPLYPEAPDNFFFTDVVAQITFGRNDLNEVIALTLHQHGFEQRATRVDPAIVEKAETVLAARIKSRTPHPDSQRLAQHMIETQLLGAPALEHMTAELAAVVVEQSDMATRDLKALGTLKALNFLTVTPEGWDAFRARFESGELDVSVFIDANGKISGALIEPPRSESFWDRLRKRLV